MLRLAATSVCDEGGMRKQLSFGSKKKVLKRRLQEGGCDNGGRGGGTMRASPLVNYHGYIKRDLVLKVFFKASLASFKIL